MRRGTWILAISGVMALNNGVGFAADPVQDTAPTERPRGIQLRNRPGATPTSNGLPSRYSRDAAAAEKSTAKNYYEELFGEPAAKPQDSGPAGAWESAGRASAAATASSAPAKPGTATTPRDAGKPAPADLSKYAATARGAKPATAGSDDKVTQATYDRLPPAAERKMIRQVRSEAAPGRSLAPPMPELGGTTETPVATQTPSAKPAASVARPAIVDNSPQTAQMTVEWVKKGDINVGQECEFELHVKNSGSVPTSQVAVDGLFPNSVRLTSADPKPTVSGEKATWSFDSMAPGAQQKISIKLIPSRRGELGATAQVRFTGSASASFRVEEPLLKLAVKGPSEVTLNDPAPQMILVTNPGTGTVHNVKVEARLSEGLEFRSPGERLVMEVGSISPGETQSVRLPLSAIKGGPQSINITASSSSDASATASAQLNVIAPSLKIAVDGPALRYIGRPAPYTLTVANDGSVPNNNVRISQKVADGFQFASADRNGKYDPSTRTVQWFVGRLEPGQTTQVNCELTAATVGDFFHTVSVLSDSGVRAEAKAQTRVNGVASLTMELVDLDDPVEIGAETAYEIRVKNEGSKAATGVTIACELPPEMELKNFKAPVGAIVEGRQVLFKSLDEVAAGGEAVYRIYVKGVREGNHRMRVRMTASSLQEPVVREEATKVYADSK